MDVQPRMAGHFASRVSVQMAKKVVRALKHTYSSRDDISFHASRLSCPRHRQAAESLPAKHRGRLSTSSPRKRLWFSLTRMQPLLCHDGIVFEIDETVSFAAYPLIEAEPCRK